MLTDYLTFINPTKTYRVLLVQLIDLILNNDDIIKAKNLILVTDSNKLRNFCVFDTNR